MMVTATRPSPPSSRPTIVTLAALTMASAAASAATYPLVSIMPMASFAMSLFLSCALDNAEGSRLVDGTDHQRVERWVRVGEVRRGDRPGGDEHPLADPAA